VLKKILEARCRKQREEQELQASLATIECDTEMAGKGSTQTVQNSTDVGAPPVTVRSWCHVSSKSGSSVSRRSSWYR
jgi:hypothetical protein